MKFILLEVHVVDAVSIVVEAIELKKNDQKSHIVEEVVRILNFS